MVLPRETWEPEMLYPSYFMMTFLIGNPSFNEKTSKIIFLYFFLLDISLQYVYSVLSV